MRYIFFDLNSTLLGRYPVWLSNQLTQSDEVVFLSFDDESWEDYFSQEDYLDAYDGVVIFGHRLPDIIFAIRAKNAGKKVFYFQHGNFKPRLERSFFSFLSLLRRKLYTYLYVFYLSLKRHEVSFASLLLFGLAAFYNNKYVGKIFTRFCPKCIDKALVFSETDIHTFENIFLGNVVCYDCIGDPNIGRFKKTLTYNYDVIIFAQTLVEDGRLDHKSFRRKLGFFLEVLPPNCRLGILLHQRSDPDIYIDMNLGDYLIYPNWNIPAADLYVSDYSSLLVTALNAGQKVSRFDFSGHKVGPVFTEIKMFPLFTQIRCNSDEFSTQPLQLR